MIFFVTGGGMNLGKTIITCSLAKNILGRGLSVLAVKPFEPWIGLAPPGLEDGELLASATGQLDPKRSIYGLRPVAVPPLAAEMVGIEIKWSDLIKQLKNYSSKCDVLLIEGCGGIATPLTWDKTALDLCKELGASAVLVGRDHAQGAAEIILCSKVISNFGIDISSILFNICSQPDGTTGQNAAVVKRFLNFDRIETLRRLVLAKQGNANAYVDKMTLVNIAAVDEAVHSTVNSMLTEAS